jgi:hypothetical protein
MNNQPTELHVPRSSVYYVIRPSALTISAVIASLIVAFRRFGHHFDGKGPKTKQAIANW